MKKYNTIIAIIIIFIIWGFFKKYRNTNTNSNIIVEQSKSILPPNNSFLYKPNGSEYSIVFTSKPTIKATATSVDGIIYKGETAEYGDDDKQSVERVEFSKVNYDLAKIFDKDYAYNFLNELATKGNYDHPSFKFDSTELGKYCEMTAFKKIIATNYTAIYRFYCVKSTAFVVTCLCQSKDFPSKEQVLFLNSIKLN